MRTAFAVSAALLTAAAIAACSGSSGPNIPDLATLSLDRELPDGGAIVLPSAFVGTEQSETIQVMNGGRHVLRITGLSLTATDGGPLKFIDGGGVFSAPEFAGGVPGSIGGLDAGFVRFNFRPSKAGRNDALLVIDNDSTGRPHVVAPVSACGVAVDGGADGGC